jgi:hypothetical protein
MKRRLSLPAVIGALLVAGCAPGTQHDAGARTAERSTTMQNQTSDLARKLSSPSATRRSRGSSSSSRSRERTDAHLPPG